MPFLNFFGRKETSVEFLRVGPHHDNDDAGEQRAPRNQNRGRSGNYHAQASPEVDVEDEVPRPSPQAPPSTLSEPVEQEGQRRCRFSLSSTDDAEGTKSKRAHFGDDVEEDTGSALSSQPGSLDSGKATVDSGTGSAMRSDGSTSEGRSEGITSATSKRTSIKSNQAPRKNSILDNRMQQLRNLRLELASIHHEAQQTRMQKVQKKLKELMNTSLAVRKGACRRCSRRLASKDFITTPFANSVCSGIILLNAMFIGLEMELNDDTGFQVQWFLLESVFLAFFIIEFALRFRAATCRQNFKDPWIVFDFAMILPGVLDTWVLQFLYASTHGMPRLTLLRLVRLARVFRVLRVVRLIRYFHELILLTRGILGAVQALSWSLVLIFMILYVSAVLTTSWYNYMTRVDSNILNTATGTRFKEWFGSIGASLLTLFQLMTLEGWPEIVRTSMDVWPQAWLFFVPFILLTNVSLLNAITAVVVEKVFSIAQNEAADEAKRAEKQRLNALKKLKQLFLSIDVDANATLDLEEFRKAMKNKEIVTILLELGIARYDADDLFECLDLDGNAELSVAEFVDGCLRAVGPAQSKHLLQVQYDLLRNFKSLRSKIGDLHSAVRIVLKQLSRVHGVKVKKSKASEIQKLKSVEKSTKSEKSEVVEPRDKDKKTTEGKKREEDENSNSAAALRAVCKDALNKREDSPRLPSKDGARRAKRAASSKAVVEGPRHQFAESNLKRQVSLPSRAAECPQPADSPLKRQVSSPSADPQQEPPPAVDTRNYKPIGSLLESTTQEQQAMSKVLHTLLEEMRDVHGHVSEVMALNWEGNRDKSRQGLPSFFMPAHNAGSDPVDDEGSAPSD